MQKKKRVQQIKKSQKVKSLCQSESTLLAHPLIPLCCLYSFFFFLHLILTKGHNTLIIPPDFPHFHPLLRSLSCTFVSLSPPSLCAFLYVLRSLFSPTPSLPLSHSSDNFIAPFLATPSFSLSGEAHIGRLTLIHLLSLSFYLLPIHALSVTASLSREMN